MFNHLLVPLDGSELSEKALPVALQALASEGTITLLNVIHLPDINFVLVSDMPPLVAAHDNRDTVLPEARKNAQAYLDDVVTRLERAPTIQIKTEVHVGQATATISERAQALHVDAIVMSTHGRSGLSRWMFGSVTQGVLGLMPCPVLVVSGQLPAPSATTHADVVQLSSLSC